MRQRISVGVDFYMRQQVSKELTATCVASDNRDYVVAGFAFLMVNKMETIVSAYKIRVTGYALKILPCAHILSFREIYKSCGQENYCRTRRKRRAERVFPLWSQIMEVGRRHILSCCAARTTKYFVDRSRYATGRACLSKLRKHSSNKPSFTWLARSHRRQADESSGRLEWSKTIPSAFPQTAFPNLLMQSGTMRLLCLRIGISGGRIQLCA
jgi:hypothetical protein